MNGYDYDGAGLSLAHRQRAASDMLRAQPDDVGSSLSRKQQQCEGEPFADSN
jgi:hypothetical protein